MKFRLSVQDNNLKGSIIKGDDNMAFSYYTPSMGIISDIINNPWFVPIAVAFIGLFMIIIVFFMIPKMLFREEGG